MTKSLSNNNEEWYKKSGKSHIRISCSGFGNVAPRLKGLLYENGPKGNVEFIDDDRVHFFQPLDGGFFWSVAECA